MGLRFCVTFLLLIVSLVAAEQTQQQCHYSCLTCTLKYHQYCKNCHEGYDFRMVKNPSEIPKQFKDTNIPTGICVNENELPSVNALGVIILIAAFVFLPITRSRHLFYITYTLQSLSLFKLLQVKWMAPTSYLLNALQYLSPCNIMTKDIKQTNWKIKIYSYYSINQLYGEAELEKSFALLGILLIIVSALIISAHLIRFLKNKYCSDSLRAFICLNEWALKYQVNYLNCFYFLLIQQTVLSFVIAFQFIGPTSFSIGTAVVYSIVTVLYCLQIFKYKIGLFYNRLIQYYSIIKKIVYPILVIVPFEYQYFFIIFTAINCGLEGFFDYKIKAYPLKSRNTAFKVLELVVVIMLGVLYGVDRNAQKIDAPKAISYIVTILLCLIFLFFFVQIILSLKQLIQRVKLEKQKEERQRNLLTENSVADREVKNALTLISSKRQQTQSQLVEGEKKGGQQKFLVLSDDQDHSPPKAEREDTKESDMKKSKDQGIQREQIKSKEDSQIQVIQIKEVKNEKKEERNKRIAKNQEKLKEELKKRYGV